MSIIPRYIEPAIEEDLPRKMVFLAGPRQVGKTTLARQILGRSGRGVYLSWDNREDRRALRRAQWPPGEALVVLDELHKFRQWKGWLKGEFDKQGERLRFLITGSSRLDVYRRGGDSLQGRYHHYRLHPLSLAELENQGPPPSLDPGQPLPIPERRAQDTLEKLLRLGGFPEPFLAQSDRVLRRWQKERLERFFREDVRDLENIRQLSSLELLADMLPERVGSPLSLNSMREDLEVSHRAVSHWIEVLDRLYFVFRVRPLASRAISAVKKMPKAYLWDWSLVDDEAARFENLVALHLLKLCHFLEDRDGRRMELCYLREKAGREVDFAVCCDRRPWFLVEAKLGDTDPAPNLVGLRRKLGVRFAFQVVLRTAKDFVQNEVRCLPASRFLLGLV